MLSELLSQYRFKSQPFATATDLVNGFKQLARDDAERRLVSDLLEEITLYDFAASDATVRALPDGGYETTFTVAVRKHYADGKGVERDAEFDNWVDVGAFTKRPDYEVMAPENVLLMTLKSMQSGQQTVSIVTDERPMFVGIDPYSKFVDRKGDDNIIEVAEK
jgi:hypothetical protein